MVGNARDGPEELGRSFVAVASADGAGADESVDEGEVVAGWLCL